jgi:tetratricopeptide (TPR) repeat protein
MKPGNGGWVPQMGTAPAFESPLAPGTILAGRYEILQLLGEGGMGAVYKARDQELDRIIALKVLHPDLARNTAALQRFKRELILARKITHKNVVRIFDLGTAAGLKFITMDFIEGTNAAMLLRQQHKFTPLAAARMVSQACHGLAAAHAEGFVHRDLKPQNIMVNAGGEVILMDFGVARSVEEGDLTRTGVLIGTPSYMSPEQGKGEKVDGRSDIYALGLVFYEFLTGRLPFESDTPMGTLLKRIQQPPPSPSKLEPAIPAPLAQIVVKCLQVDPADRYRTVQELQQDLDTWIAEQTGTVAPIPLVRRTGEKRFWKWTALALVLALAVGTALVWRQFRPKRPHKPVSVLVADFDNATGDSVLDGTLEPMMGFAMEAAPFVTAFNRSDARKTEAQLQAGATRLDSEMARLVAIREGIDVVISGVIKRTEQGYAVSVSATDAVTGKTIINGQDNVPGKDQLMAAVPKLAASVRGALGDVSAESNQLAAETFTAASVEAAHQYSLGQDFQFAAKWDDAIRAYSKAVELDPTLGRAYAGLAVVYYNLGQLDKAQPYFDKAMSLIDRMTERERYRTRGGYFIRTGDISAAIDEYSRLLSQYPADSAALNNLALAYSLRRDMPKAVTYARQSSALYPKSALRRANVAIFSMYADDFAGAEKEAEATIQLNADYPKAFIVRGLAQLAQGKTDAALQSYRHVESALSPALGALGLADLALYQGRMDDAFNILQAAITRAHGDKMAAMAARQLIMLAQAQLSMGHKVEAMKAASDAVTEDASQKVSIEAARIFAEAGNESKARQLAATLNTKLNKDYQAYARIIEGEILLQRGDALAAVQQFRQANEIADTWLGRFDLGRAYLAADAFPEAHAEFTACQQRRGEAAALFLDEMPTFHDYPATFYYLALAQQGLKSPAAVDSFRNFVILKVPESTEPLVVDARRRLGGF